MASPPLANAFEGGSDGTTITPANSGGSSGDAFDAVTATQPTFSNVQKRGNLSMQIASPAANYYAEWDTLGTLTSDLYIRIYLYLLAAPTGAHCQVFKFLTGAASTVCGLRVSTASEINLTQQTDTLIAGTDTGVYAYNQWTRVEAHYRLDNTAGNAEWRLYNTADAAVGDYDYNASAQFDFTGATIDQLRVGITAGIPTSYTAYWDDIAVSTTGWIGPTAVGQTLLPDADLAAGGWINELGSATPLYSKVADSSDSTYMRGTAA